MAASLQCRNPQVTAPTLAQQAVPGAGAPGGEQSSRSEWCGARNREQTLFVRRESGGW